MKPPQIKHSVPNWYVVYTYPNFEKKVHDRLSRKNIVSYLPLQKTVRQWSDRKKTLEMPLFPNYLFVYTNNLERYIVQDIPGVARFVTFDGSPVVISDNEINLIREIAADRDIFIEQDFKEGDTVKILRGPLAGLSGVLFERKGKARYAIRIAAISQTVSIEICTSLVEKIEEMVF